MKRIILSIAATALFIGGIGVGTNFGQDKSGADGCAEKACGEKTDNGCEEESAELDDATKKMLEAYRETTKAGPEHEVLKKFVGKWDVKVKMWFMGGKTPVIRKSETEFKLIHDGRYLTSEIEMGEPMPHKGISYMGYDKDAKKYNYLSLTSMATGMRIYTGDYDKEKNTIELKCNYTMKWGTQEIDVEERDTWVIEDDKITMTVHSKYPGNPMMGDKEIREIEITYTRKK